MPAPADPSRRPRHRRGFALLPALAGVYHLVAPPPTFAFGALAQPATVLEAVVDRLPYAMVGLYFVLLGLALWFEQRTPAARTVHRASWAVLGGGFAAYFLLLVAS